MSHTKKTERTVVDLAREPWDVEERCALPEGGVVLRYRHELGYELLAVAPAGLDHLEEAELVRILETARHRTPPSERSSAA